MPTELARGKARGSANLIIAEEVITLHDLVWLLVVLLIIAVILSFVFRGRP